MRVAAKSCGPHSLSGVTMPEDLPFSVIGSRIFGKIDQPFKSGDTISLVLSKCPFLSFPGTNICLTIESPSDTITDMTMANPDACKMIVQMISDGFVVIGPPPVTEIPLEGIDAILASMDKAPKLHGFDTKSWLGMIKALAVDGLSKAEILNKCLEHEIQGQCRDDFINFIDRLMARVYGPQAIQDTPEKEVKLVGTNEQKFSIMTEPAPGSSVKLDI